MRSHTNISTDLTSINPIGRLLHTWYETCARAFSPFPWSMSLTKMLYIWYLDTLLSKPSSQIHSLTWTHIWPLRDRLGKKYFYLYIVLTFYHCQGGIHDFKLIGSHNYSCGNFT